MRFVTYGTDDGDRAGVLNGELVHALPPGTTLLGLLGPDLGRQASGRSPSRTRSWRWPTSG